METLQLATAHELPLPDKNTQGQGMKSLLLICLIDLKDTEEASLVQHFQHSLHDKNVTIHHGVPLPKCCRPLLTRPSTVIARPISMRSPSWPIVYGGT